MQDKAHFFFSYEGKGFEVSADPVAVPDRFSTFADDLPAGVQSRLGSVTRPFNEDLYFGKIDWDIGENDRLELTGKYRDEESRDSVGGQTTAIASKINLNTEKRFDLRWQHYGERYVNEARVSYEDVLFNPTAYTLGSQTVYTRGIAEDDVLLNDGATSGLAIQRKGQKGPSFQNDLTFNNLGAARQPRHQDGREVQGSGADPERKLCGQPVVLLRSGRWCRHCGHALPGALQSAVRRCRAVGDHHQQAAGPVPPGRLGRQ